MTLSQLWRLTFLETGLMGGTAGILAMPVGFILAWILIYVINLRSFGWTLQMYLEPGYFVQAFLIAVVAALLAAIYPSLRLGKTVIASAIRGSDEETLLVGLIVGLLVVIGWVMVARTVGFGETPASTLITALSAEADEGYARATETNNIEFPRDFGAHDDYQTEWWYYTGNLETEDARQFGFQFTIFRRALSPQSAVRQIPESTGKQSNLLRPLHN